MYISKELVFNEGLSELDLELKDKFKFDWESDIDFIEIDVIKDKKLRNGYYVNTTPLDILDLEKIVKKFKAKGVTHVQMAHHGDHHGYEFSGFKIGLADDELIAKYDAESLKRDKLYKEYNRLKNQMNKLRYEIDELKI